jgi:hypothetical protein
MLFFRLPNIFSKQHGSVARSQNHQHCFPRELFGFELAISPAQFGNTSH